MASEKPSLCVYLPIIREFMCVCSMKQRMRLIKKKRMPSLQKRGSQHFILPHIAYFIHDLSFGSHNFIIYRNINSKLRNQYPPTGSYSF